MREQVVRIDLYTKAVLTVIAACLLWICASGSGVLSPPAAEAAVQAGKLGATSAAQAGSTGRVGVAIEAPLRGGAVPVYVVGGTLSAPTR